MKCYRFVLIGLLLCGLTGCGGGGSASSDGSSNEAANSTVADAANAGSDSGSSGGGAADTGAGASNGTIGFSVLTLKNPFFKIIADTLTAEAEKQGFSVLVNDANLDVDTQAKHLDNYLSQKVTAIVLNPADRIAIGPAIKKATDAGIPVFTCDLQCVSDDAEIAGHVGTDNYAGGRQAGEAMAEVLGEEGGDVLVLHFKQANSCVLRVNGFTDVVNAANEKRADGKINVVAELNGGGLRDVGHNATADAIVAYPNLRGIFAINDPSALGARKALEEAGKADQVRIIGFDGQIEGKQAIKDGEIFADPIQFPDQMAILTMQNIQKYLDGEEFEKVNLITPKLYKKADADQDPDLQ